MRRREFITLLGTMAIWPLAACTQPTGRAKAFGVEVPMTLLARADEAIE